MIMGHTTLIRLSPPRPPLVAGDSFRTRTPSVFVGSVEFAFNFF